MKVVFGGGETCSKPEVAENAYFSFAEKCDTVFKVHSLQTKCEGNKNQIFLKLMLLSIKVSWCTLVSCK